MARPLIALLTDFGLHDHYVGVMKGVILGICPDAQLVDLTHDIPPQNIRAAIEVLDAAYRFFPPGTIFLGVVDPGVGTGRRSVAIEADGYCFVGPDNGLFSQVVARAASVRSVELASAAHARSEISRTFEGRDRFAPAAAWLARGVHLETFGPLVTSLVSLDRIEPVAGEQTIDGEVLSVDRFGNLMTNIGKALLDALARPYAVTIGGQDVSLIVSTYAEAPEGALCALVGSAGRLEIAMSRGNAAAALHAAAGAPVHVRALAW